MSPLVPLVVLVVVALAGWAYRRIRKLQDELTEAQNQAAVDRDRHAATRGEVAALKREQTLSGPGAGSSRGPTMPSDDILERLRTLLDEADEDLADEPTPQGASTPRNA